MSGDDRLIGSITKVLWDCAEVLTILDPYAMSWHTRKELNEAAKYYGKIIEIMLDIRVGNRVYINDKREGVIGGVIVEETGNMIVVKFDRPPKVGSEVYI